MAQWTVVVAVNGTDGTKNSDEMKDLDNYAKKLLKYIAKQWTSIFKTLKAAGDGEDNEKEEEESDDG